MIYLKSTNGNTIIPKHNYRESPKVFTCQISIEYAVPKNNSDWPKPLTSIFSKLQNVHLRPSSINPSNFESQIMQ